MAVKLDKRTAWMAEKCKLSFCIDEETVNKFFETNYKRIEQFYSPDAPPKLFFYYQGHDGKKDEIYLSTDGNSEKLKGKCVYFLRNSPKPIKKDVNHDGTVVFGEISSQILESLQQTLAGLYGPLVTNNPTWGKITKGSDRQTFMDQLLKFHDGLKKKIANLRGDVELKLPGPGFDDVEQKPAAYAKAAKNPDLISHFKGVVSSWCDVISKYMADDKSVIPMKPTDDSGPDVEIEYWSRRMLTLISVTEQLKSKQARVVTGVLKARALKADSQESSANPEQMEHESVKLLIESWRETDLAITDHLNEAKDNVRFLENLRKVLEPLYMEKPEIVSEAIPSVMNSMKMIHTLSRHYGTEVRMTNLFSRITNQLIVRCKEDIYAAPNTPPYTQLWSPRQSPEAVITKMEASIALFECVEREYHETKSHLANMPKGKQFDFDETIIFGKFMRFRRRLEKLIDMFSSVKQFRDLESKHIDGLEKLIASFDQLVNEFKMKNHDLLDFNKNEFERDFVEFTMHNSGLENAIQDFVEITLSHMSSIEKQLDLMSKFRDALHRETLKDDLEQKYTMIFKLYGEDLAHIHNLYEKHKTNPDKIGRNMTQCAGNIQWSRQLFRRITVPMKKFEENPKVFSSKDSKRIIKLYNKVARVLIEFEKLWFSAWVRASDDAKRNLRSTLLVKDEETGLGYVNFDPGVLSLMREAKHLQLMGFEIPTKAKIVLLLAEKFKNCYQRLGHALQVYHDNMNKVSEVARSLLKPHLADIEEVLKPAYTTMTWVSMNIETFLDEVYAVLKRFSFLVSQINDIVENRIEKNLKFMRTLILVNLPNEAVTLSNFQTDQAKHVEQCKNALEAKNSEVKRAVDDLIRLVKSYVFANPDTEPTDQLDINFVQLHYNNKTFHSLLDSAKYSLLALKSRLFCDGETPKLFEMQVALKIPTVVFVPSLDEMQEIVNEVVRGVLRCSKTVSDWGYDPTSRPRAAKPFFDKLACDKGLTVLLLTLAGAVEKTKVIPKLDSAQEYSWVWEQDPEAQYTKFVQENNPILEDVIAELNRFVSLGDEFANLVPQGSFGCLLLKTDSLKSALQQEVDRWKSQYSERLHKEAKKDMDAVTDKMAEMKGKLERELKDIGSLKFVMDAQSEIREAQSWIEQKFTSIIDRYNSLEKYLPFGIMSKDEMDAKSVLKTQWSTILVEADKAMIEVNKVQAPFKTDLIMKVVQFQKDVVAFKEDYDSNGPMVPGTTPAEAMTRLAKYKREFETLYRKFELYNGGEKLFGLPEMKYESLEQTKKELKLLDQLYSLYQGVITTVDEYKSINWSEVVENVEEMNSTIEDYAAKCKKLPKTLRGWDAYLELSSTIEGFIQVLPLLTELSKPSMRKRHWDTISELTGTEFDFDKFHELKLKSVLEANILTYQEDIEEITDGAEKQLAIEKKIKEIADIWEARSFEFSGWKERGDVILAGGCVAETIEALEESQSSLIQMLTQRHVTPFRELASSWLKKLSDVNDTLESWVKVQLLWMSLEAVFSGGDIARQMPQDTRVFMKVDKEWTTRMMSKAKEVLLVADCCQNEYIKNMLPSMFSDLEKCQKALDGYLENKRSKFPRFYFVSNPALLLILSQGSDKEAVQDCFAKIFDAIDKVEFQGNNVVKMRSLESGYGGKQDSEDIPLTKPVLAKGNIEEWLYLMLKEMARTIKDIVRSVGGDYESMGLADMIKKYCGQACLLGIQFMWTTDVQEGLQRMKSDKNAISSAFKKQAGILSMLSEMTTKEIPTKMERTKIETLVTIQVHQKDVLEDIAARVKAKKLKDMHDFEWQKQLRCYWVPESDNCFVKVADVDFAYCCEYLGCKERLCVTPLTDRCYITLTQALGMCFGGAPAGPAGTGKTETVKDLGRGLGKYVVVFNCSDQMHTADTAKIYKGLCMSGSWGCFDEFNRIDLEVLSVVAQQVQAVLACIRARNKSFFFPGDDTDKILVDTRCGFFITMNPGYAGRQELPENLKALFRGVTMMVPDREIIIKVKLASVGFNDFAPLSKKFRVLYSLCEEQLSKQRHYDFGLRNILSVLRTAGVNLRTELKKDASGDRADMEEMVMMRTLRDMNLAKLVSDDCGLFISLLHDLFPNQKDPEKFRYDAEEAAMATIIDERKLIQHETWVNKIIQLYETSLVRHGLMMCGPAGGGKTQATEVLIDALTLTHGKHTIVKMNPKAIKATEMFGQNDVISGEWTHGIFSSIWHKYNDLKKPNSYIICDGPVDAIWIENLNTVLDDNKLLTLANGDRIPMTANVRILFEVEDLRNASPATVSRAGIVYVSDTDLGFEPLIECWMRSRREEERAAMETLFEKYLTGPSSMDFVNRNTTKMMNTSPVHFARNILVLITGLLKPSVDAQTIHPPEVLEKLVIYAFAWTLGSLAEAEDRKKVHDFMVGIAPAELLPVFKNGETIYEYYVDEKELTWALWEAPEWEFPAVFNFANTLIPTIDSARAEYLVEMTLNRLNYPVMIIGSSGTAKTSIVLQYCIDFDPTKMLLKKVNFSSATTAGMFQTSIEADIEKRQGKTYAPGGGKSMTVFLDDISMPEVNNWGDQPTLEIVRQMVEENGIYFLEKDKRGERMKIENLRFIGAMSHPGGGRNDIPARLKRHFFVFNMTPPSVASIDNIYGSMLRGYFAESPLEEIVEQLTSSTIELWTKCKTKMLPTPSKFHYIFNMRDLSRVFQGVLHSPLESLVQGDTCIELWAHECERVLCDKLVDAKDKGWFLAEAKKCMASHYDPEVVEKLQSNPDPVYFVDFLRDDVIDEETDEVVEAAPKVYEPVRDLPWFKQRVENSLAKYNDQGGGVQKMDLVLFQDALQYMLRISRITGMPRGNALLVGVGGSGRQSLTRLATFIGGQESFQIKLTRSYKIPDFLEDIRKLYVWVGKEGKKCTWIFTDFEILNEDMLEYINAILSTGEIAGLFTKDERDMMVSELRGPAKAEDPSFDDTPANLYKYFVDRIRSNLHIVLCFSPANEKFAERARKFPGLISCCTINWFLRWPEQALVAVSSKFIANDEKFKVDATDEVRDKLIGHIAKVHDLVTTACTDYFQKFRRAVFVTPKSYLSFISAYKETYVTKVAAIDVAAKNVNIGLAKLKDAEVDVDKMKGVLEVQNVELAEAEKAASAMLEKLEVGAKEANEKKAAADVIEEKCTATANTIAEETRLANIELEAAMPFVRAASAAAEKVTKPDIGIIQKLPKPPDLIKRIMDCVLILNLGKLDKVSVTEIKVGKDMLPFVMDSYDSYAKKFMGASTFISDLLNFAVTEKDLINDETMELLDPYLDCADFNPDSAKRVSGAAEGLCMWVRAMHSYHTASLIVAPKLEQLKIKSGLFEVAQNKLNAAKASSAAAQAEVDELQRQFQETMDEKARLEKKAKETQDKMVAANNLIQSLGGEKVRWSADAANFADGKRRLVGDCALACAFVSYLGPFNNIFRKELLENTFYKDCMDKNIPVSKNMEVTKFLVDEATIAEWNSQSLPKDDLSIQNGILVTSASRFPLLIDPQGQALQWLNKREAANFPNFGTTSVTNSKLRDQLEFCMEEGKPLLCEGVVKEVDPMFDPVLLKNVVKKGRSMFIMLGDKAVTFDPGFRLYLLCKLGNPTFSPELSAKTTIIDFSVTQKGLEDQLLSRVIQFEQKSLEDQRQQLVEEVNMNTISLQALDKELLERLSASSGNLLDDVALIKVLADTKTKAQEVKEKIEASVATEIVINKKREQYRPVATRGSVVYFVIVACSAINCMYQTSLAQFLSYFDQSMIDAEKANLVTKRVQILMDHLTFAVYIHIDRGFFEVDKLIFKMMFTTKIMCTETNDLNDSMVNLLLRGGAAMLADQQPRKPFDWFSMDIWMNICCISQSLDFFGDLRTSIEQNEADWKKWYESETPESEEIPKLEERLDNHPSGTFFRLLILRCFRQDRFRLGALEYISKTMGQKYIDPVPARMEDVWEVSEPFNPVVLMLTPGADPTSQLEELAKKKGVQIHAVSMGEGQEPFAAKAINVSQEEGGWALLQNCHLGLGFMKTTDEELQKAKKEKQVHEAFRLWITCEPHPDFPINLLQSSVKVTNEPPAGMKAGLFRSYTSTVDAERLARVETKEWRDLVFGMCFMHSVVQERRKFGAIGWCIPYEFNTGDLEASLQFLEKHSFSPSGLNWDTVQYMVCEIQYGGRITDDFDRCLFNTFGTTWLNERLLSENFLFYDSPHFKYNVPQMEAIEAIRSYITNFPSHDSPEIFGLHGNADLTFGTAESIYILDTINDTQPKETSSSKGAKTREEIVHDKAEELLALVPEGYKDEIVRDQVRKRSSKENEFVLGYKPEGRVDGLSIPLNVFLYQEIVRINFTINNVRTTLRSLMQAINGEIIMTPQLQDALGSIFDAKAPVHWYTDASGASIAWQLPTLALWFQSLVDREKQLNSWLNTTRPVTYWLTGFFNPQGFLTAARQEVTRRHKAERWALDDVVLKCDVLEHLNPARIRGPPDEGVLIHGLYLEGCSWDKSGKLKESAPKELFCPLPILKVTAVTSQRSEKIYNQPGKHFYDCPCYMQPKRTDLNYIFVVKLESDVPAAHWVLRGVALLCTKD
eukprot:CAMPEP_0175163132 /NCGR_PEP_ID=MMETSP0087-20121206/25561_1 /TAXON_ID=136419 /ORGANISM="Unknown Unknown, Strain D1" /LENGTH=4572 /DNA_ID=CAMNT_0016451765 /DNA_START=103 /DNA_END=13822 /DNA_ORIENTATION=+